MREVRREKTQSKRLTADAPQQTREGRACASLRAARGDELQSPATVGAAGCKQTAVEDATVKQVSSSRPRRTIMPSTMMMTMKAHGLKPVLSFDGDDDVG